VTGWTDAQLAARVPISSIIDAPGGRIPYQPWALKRREEIFHRYGGDDITGAPQSVRDVSSELLCVIGAPRLMFFADFQIVQTSDQIVMTWERSSDFRIIPLRDRPRLPAGVKLHNGDSIGHWDGNTLVIDTTNLNDWSWFDSKGSFHTDAMTLVERLTVLDPKTIDYKVTVTDPKAFTQPWTMNFTLKQRHTPAEHYEIYEMKFFSLSAERKIGVFAEAFNLFNTANFGNSYTGNGRSATFRQPTGFIPGIGYARQLQLGARFLF
jgi:hypothetical protein